jgi:hypothetical protein
MPIFKKGLSKSGWLWIIIIVALIVALPVLHVLGVLDLSFIGAAFVGYTMFGAVEPIIGVLQALGYIGLGVLIFYVLKTYIVGTKVSTQGQGYMPQGQVLSQSPQADNQTVVT